MEVLIMAQPIFVNVPENFSMGVFAGNMERSFTAKGYTVQTNCTETNATFTVSKGMDGALTKWSGLGESVVVNCTVANNQLTVAFMNEEWTNKIVAMVAGWFCCTILFITGIVGIVRQVNLPKNVGADAMLLANQSVVYETPVDFQ